MERMDRVHTAGLTANGYLQAEAAEAMRERGEPTRAMPTPGEPIPTHP